MARVINCECGRQIRGDSEDELLDRAEAHVREDHPELVGQLTRDDLLAMSEEQ